jgi:hypothetical protein
MARGARRGAAPRSKRASRGNFSRRKSSRRWRLLGWLPSAATRKRWLRRYRAAPAGLQIVIGLAALGIAWLGINGIYQVVRKPSELFFPVSGVLYKTPSETWKTYAPIFRRHSTATMTPQLLAALAQVEASGNPIARTYWRWRLHSDPFEVYRPASSAVGMYQITDGTFAASRRYCIHDHVVVEDGPWNDWKSCWFNSLYTRTIPSHAVELTSAYLDRSIERILARNGIRHASLKQKHELATLIHLCGAGAGNRFAARGFQLTPGQRCGDHSAQGYIDKVEAMQRTFQRLAGS